MGKFFWFTNPTLGNMKAIGEYHEAKGDNPAHYRLIAIPGWYTPEFKARDFYEHAKGNCLLVKIPESSLPNDWVIGDAAPPYEIETNSDTRWELPAEEQAGRMKAVSYHLTVKVGGEVVFAHSDVKWFDKT